MTHNSDFFQNVLQLHALPAIQIYSRGLLLDSFACPPKMFSSLKHKVESSMQKQTIGPESTTLMRDTRSLNPTTHDAKVSNEFFAEADDDDIPFQISDMFMTDDDNDDDEYANVAHLPRNNIIPVPGASEFFASSAHDDIPLQLSDMFMNDDDEDDMYHDDDDHAELANTILSSLIPTTTRSSSTHLVPCDDGKKYASVLHHHQHDSSSGNNNVNNNMPRNNNMIRQQGANEFLARYGAEIPLQPSDLFLAAEEEDNYYTH